LAVTIANMIADIVYCLIDPRLGLRGPPRQRGWVTNRWRSRPQASITETAIEG